MHDSKAKKTSQAQKFSKKQLQTKKKEKTENKPCYEPNSIRTDASRREGRAVTGGTIPHRPKPLQVLPRQKRCPVKIIKSDLAKSTFRWSFLCMQEAKGQEQNNED